MMSMSEAATHHMQCMEVWGGNHAADVGVNMLGLDAWVYSRPHGGAESGGGDVHYVSSCASGSITRLLLADVSGHGALVAQTARTLRDLMRDNVNKIDQQQVIRGLNAEFNRVTKDDGFATALVFTFFVPRERLSLLNAGHPPPLVYRAGERTWSALRATAAGGRSMADIPLGIDRETPYGELRTTLSRDDMVLCYSDALIEAPAAGDGGRRLGVDGLLRHVRGLPVDDPATLIGRLIGAIESSSGERLDHDDVTALLFRRNELSAGVPWRRVALAPLKMARRSLTRLVASRN